MGEIRFHTAAECVPGTFDTETDKGIWVFDPALLTLTHKVSGYEIDLEDCTTSAELLDWIIQVSAKGWADDKTMGALIRRFNQLLRPQAFLCSWGAECGPIEVKRVVESLLKESKE